ncbi:hypothetical protein A6746_10210 [Pseudomonas aeruginosa]|nr:hypothetical protein A6746_10210 [Pseudomonas aeruginosa]
MFGRKMDLNEVTSCDPVAIAINVNVAHGSLLLLVVPPRSPITAAQYGYAARFGEFLPRLASKQRRQQLLSFARSKAPIRLQQNLLICWQMLVRAST